MSVLGVFEHRYRGFRVVEIGGIGVLLVLILLVYLAKTSAGGEGARIDRVQQQISDEQARVALLRAEVASLEQPERLETLSNRYLGLQPVDAKHEIDAQALASIVHAPDPAQPKPSGSAAQSATPPAATPNPGAVVAHPSAPAPTEVAADAASVRPSELKPAATDPIGDLSPTPAPPAEGADPNR
jgi:cell division protein FtsL